MDCSKNLVSVNKVIAVLILLSGCASKRQLNLASSPSGATVYSSTSFSSEFKEIGKTPLTIDLKKEVSDDRFAYLSFKADGHDNYRIVIPSNYSTGSIEVKLNEQAKVTDEELKKEIEGEIREGYEAQNRLLKDQLQLAQNLAQQQKIAYDLQYQRLEEDLKKEYSTKSNLIFNKVIEVQNALHVKQLAKAGKALAEMKTLDPPPSLVLTLEGNFEFINGRINRALASYKRALDLDPTNVELAGVLAELRKVVR